MSHSCSSTSSIKLKKHNVGLAADGVDVAVADLSSKRNALEQLAKEIEATGRQAISVIVDVSNEREVQEMVAQTVKALGGLDIVRMLKDSMLGPTLTNFTIT